MFAEQPIIGEQESKIMFPTNKIHVPAFSQAEAGEILYLVNSNRGYLNLYSRSYIEKYNELIKILETSNNPKDIERLEKVKKQIDYFYASTIIYKKVTPKKEFLIPKIVVERYFPNHTMYIVGKGDHLSLYRSKQSYELSREQVRVRK